MNRQGKIASSVLIGQLKNTTPMSGKTIMTKITPSTINQPSKSSRIALQGYPPASSGGHRYV